jgi:hypothetical protein
LLTDDPITLAVRRAASWRYVGPAVFSLVAAAEVGGRLSPLPVSLVLRCFSAAAVILLVKLTVWVVTSYATFKRDERLIAFVSLLIVVGSWYGTRAWVFERAFDDLVATQNRNLKLTLNELSGKILVFVAARGQHAPPPPKPDTWDRDQAEIMHYRQETQVEFEATFGKEVRTAHNVLGLFSLTDRDFERFYRQPSDPFEMTIVARKLAFFSAKIPL